MLPGFTDRTTWSAAFADEQSGGAADETEHQAFRHQLAHQPAASSRRAPCAPRLPSAGPSRVVSSRFATFAHAISSTSITEPSSTSTASFTLPTTDSTSETTSIVNVSRAYPGLECTRAMAATSVFACAIVTPGFRCAMMLKFSSPAPFRPRFGAERKWQKYIHTAGCSPP